MSVVEIEALVKRYGDRVALDGIDLSIGEGETVALLGGNGSGKTTLIRVLAGMTTPTRGSVRLGDHDVVRARRRAAAETGVVGASEHTWYLRLTGRQNLELFAALRGLPREVARSGLDEVGLARSSDVTVGGYSRGMRARLAVARARLGRPPFLFLDEPSANLDAEGAELLAGLLDRREHRAVVLATHSPAEAAAVADRAVVLRDGHVGAELAGPLTAERVAAVARPA